MTEFIYHNTDKIQGDSNALCSHCETGQGDDWIMCDKCDAWYHFSCIGIDPDLYIGENAPRKDEAFMCNRCQPYLFDDIGLNTQDSIYDHLDASEEQENITSSQINLEQLFILDPSDTSNQYIQSTASQASNNGYFFDATNVENIPLVELPEQDNVGIDNQQVMDSQNDKESPMPISENSEKRAAQSSATTESKEVEDELFIVEKIIRHRKTVRGKLNTLSNGEDTVVTKTPGTRRLD